MKIEELYKQTPAERHHEIAVSGDRLFLDGDEYVIEADEELKLIRSNKQLDQRLDQIVAKLGIT